MRLKTLSFCCQGNIGEHIVFPKLLKNRDQLQVMFTPLQNVFRFFLFSDILLKATTKYNSVLRFRIKFQNRLISRFERCLIKMSNYLSTFSEGEPILKGSTEGLSSVILSCFLSKIGKTDSNFATM